MEHMPRASQLHAARRSLVLSICMNICFSVSILQEEKLLALLLYRFYIHCVYFIS